MEAKIGRWRAVQFGAKARPFESAISRTFIVAEVSFLAFAFCLLTSFHLLNISYPETFKY
jgi:hypothetical protein